MDLTSRYNHTIKKLQSISAIQSGQYWNTTQQRPQTPGILTTIYRTMYTSECRDYNIQDIKISYETAFELIRYLYEKRENKKILKLDSEIINSIYAINNLKTVYHDSEITKMEIDRMYIDIKNKYYEIQDKYLQVSDSDEICYTPTDSV